MATAAAFGSFEAAQGEFERMLLRGMRGIEYFASPAPVLGVTERDMLIARGSMRLAHYRARVDDVYRVPVLLVMATTNRGYIFDMVPGQSLVAYLLDAGFDVFMLEWEPPSRQEWTLTFESYVLDFLPAAVARIAEETGGPDISVVGYCFGGVLSLLWDNALMNGTMSIGRRRIDLRAITAPFLHVTAEHDHIVATAASAPLIGMIGSDDREQIVLKGGHISLVAGANAVKRMWPTLAGWLAPRSV